MLRGWRIAGAAAVEHRRTPVSVFFPWSDSGGWTLSQRAQKVSVFLSSVGQVDVESLVFKQSNARPDKSIRPRPRISPYDSVTSKWCVGSFFVFVFASVFIFRFLLSCFLYVPLTTSYQNTKRVVFLFAKGTLDARLLIYTEGERSVKKAYFKFWVYLRINYELSAQTFGRRAFRSWCRVGCTTASRTTERELASLGEQSTSSGIAEPYAR